MPFVLLWLPLLAILDLKTNVWWLYEITFSSPRSFRRAGSSFFVYAHLFTWGVLNWVLEMSPPAESGGGKKSAEPSRSQILPWLC